MNRRPGELSSAIQAAAGGRIRTPIEWVSPLEAENHREYRGEAALDRLGLTLTERTLASFWPEHEPEWNALGVDGSGAAVLVEGTSRMQEMLSAPPGIGPSSKARIGAALEEVAEHLGGGGSLDWSTTFYRYTSRLAHLHLLQELNGVDSWLVFVYFIGDDEVQGPRGEEEWWGTLNEMHRALGLPPIRLPDRRIDVFLDVG